MVSAADLAKRALVTLLKFLAGLSGVGLSVSGDSTDKEVHTAYRKISRKTHPDHGGSTQHQSSLKNAFEEEGSHGQIVNVCACAALIRQIRLGRGGQKTARRHLFAAHKHKHLVQVPCSLVFRAFKKPRFSVLKVP